MKNRSDSKGLFITGTDTDVGKTYIGVQIVTLLHDNGINVIPRKPIESGCKKVADKLIPADASRYFEATNKKIPLDEICPFRFEPAISPQRAARLVNQPIFLNDVIKFCKTNITKNDFLVVEGAGGFYSPLCEDADNSELAKLLGLPVILVAEDKLGCINHILLSIEAIEKQGLILLAIILNQVNDSDSGKEEMNNLEDITMLVDVPIFLMPNHATFGQRPMLSTQLLKLLTR